MPTLCHVSADTPAEEVARIIHRDGAVIVKDVVDPALLDRIEVEMQPFIDNSRYGNSTISGRTTRRTGGLIARSPTARELIMHPLVLGVVQHVITHPIGLQLSNTEIISIDPGETYQPLHRDQDLWPYPFPPGYEVQCNMMWPLNNDFTVENGATRMLPGSHKTGFRSNFRDEEIVQAEMKRGSVMFWTGSVYHSGSANRSEKTRRGFNVSYTAGWLRQEENQYLVVPHEIARQLDDDLLRLIGYERPTHGIGNAVDRSHPLGFFRPEFSNPNQNDESLPNYMPYAGEMDPIVPPAPKR